VNVAETTEYGALKPRPFDQAVIAVTSRMPVNWLGLKAAIVLRRLVTMRLAAGALDVERWGMRMRLHPRDNGCEKNLLFTPQMYEPEERAELAAEMARAETEGRPFTFIDIGANVGLFSLFVAARAGPRARILAIEPEPGNVARLRFNIAANPGVSIRPLAMALADHDGDVAVELNRRDRGGTQTRKLTAAETPAGTLRAPCRSLLRVLHDEGIDRIDALKIDVEGAEDTILVPFFRDAPQSLLPRLVLIEDTPGRWSVDVYPVLAANGFSISSRSRSNVMLRRG